MQTNNSVRLTEQLDRGYIYEQLRKINLIQRVIDTVHKEDKGMQERTEPSSRTCYLTLKTTQHRLSAAVDAYIEEQTASECRAWCEAFQERLPRELRNMVYPYLLPPCTSLIRTADLWSNFSQRTKRFSLGAPQLLQSACRDARTSIELLHFWYTYSTFHFDTFEHIKPFLSNDVWGFDMPVRELARNFHIHIGMRQNAHPRNFSAALEGLLWVKPGAKITLFLSRERYDAHGYAKESADSKFTVTMTMLAPLVRRLLDTGHSVFLMKTGIEKFSVRCEHLCGDAWQSVIERFLAGGSDHATTGELGP